MTRATSHKCAFALTCANLALAACSGGPLGVLESFGDVDVRLFAIVGDEVALTEAVPVDKAFVLDLDPLEFDSLSVWAFAYELDDLAAKYRGFRGRPREEVSEALHPSFGDGGDDLIETRRVLFGKLDGPGFAYQQRAWPDWTSAQVPRLGLHVEPSATCPDGGSSFVVFDYENPHLSVEALSTADCAWTYQLDGARQEVPKICSALLNTVERGDGSIETNDGRVCRYDGDEIGAAKLWTCPSGVCGPGAARRFATTPWAPGNWRPSFVASSAIALGDDPIGPMLGDRDVILHAFARGPNLVVREYRRQPPHLEFIATDVIDVPSDMGAIERISANASFDRLVVAGRRDAVMFERSGPSYFGARGLPPSVRSELIGEATQSRDTDEVFVPTVNGLVVLDRATNELRVGTQGALASNDYYRVSVARDDLDPTFRVVLCAAAVAGFCRADRSVLTFDAGARLLFSHMTTRDVVAITDGPRLITQTAGSADVFVKVLTSVGAETRYVLPGPAPTNLPVLHTRDFARDALVTLGDRPYLFYTFHVFAGLVELETGRVTSAEDKVESREVALNAPGYGARHLVPHTTFTSDDATYAVVRDPYTHENTPGRILEIVRLPPRPMQ